MVIDRTCCQGYTINILQRGVYMQTPMMKQYKEIKNKYKDYIVFFRLGDFYEMFFEDAELCSRELEIALTTRDHENKVPMAGVPHHAAEQYIARLINKGYKVVICEQVEDPKTAKGIVKREVVKIVTPGTVTDINALEDEKNNYLGSIYSENDNFGLAFVDILTGEFFTTEFKSEPPFQEVINELAKVCPKECLVNEGFSRHSSLYKKLSEDLSIYLTVKSDNYFDLSSAKKYLIEQFGNEQFTQILAMNYCQIASGAALKYLEETHNNSLTHIDEIKLYENNDYMILDLSCRRNLELTQTLRDNKKTGTLLWVLDNTQTSMGARLLRKWIEQPLTNIIKINERLDCVEELLNNYFLREELKSLFKDIYDIERLTGKLVCGSVNARDLLAIKNTIGCFPAIKKCLSKFSSKLFLRLKNQLDTMDDLFDLLEKSINLDPPLSVRETGIIRDGYNPEIDKLRKATKEGKNWLAKLEKREREATGIKSLKVGYNKVFGYYIEVTKSNLSLVPEGYIRKQTLVGGERYITEELKNYESMILNAEQRLQELEYDTFCIIREELAGHAHRLKQSAYSIAALDSLLSFAETSYKYGYTKPEISLGDELFIKDGRHPVVERSQKDEVFIPNDTNINCTNSVISIITGPNMAGKSTYMRQVALITIMAQIGCFVPAKKARIGLVDRVFTRIGASDDLSAGKSTFMVEMTEVAYILKNATNRSLLILDEVGRGTSTYDGLSIAWAVIEYIHKNIAARTLFATHYHELTCLDNMEGVKNYQVSVKERGEEIVFLRKIIPGETDKSYGIQVARLAGLPNSVISRAKNLLKDLEEKYSTYKQQAAAAMDSIESSNNSDEQISLDELNEKEAIRKLKSIDPNTVTPLEALNLLFSLKQKLG
jgi:DNA mismatch repair protein MutS